MGATFIELLAVVAIILILTTMYWSSGTQSRSKRQLLACQGNLRDIFMALQVYANDQAGKFPAVAGARSSEEALDVLVPRFTIKTTVFVCPASKDPPLPDGESFRQRKISYAYYMGHRAADSGEVVMTDQQVNSQSKTAGQPLFSSNGQPPGNNHRQAGGNLLFGDGRAESCPASAPSGLVLTSGIVLLNPNSK